MEYGTVGFVPKKEQTDVILKKSNWFGSWAETVEHERGMGLYLLIAQQIDFDSDLMLWYALPDRVHYSAIRPTVVKLCDLIC